MAMEEPGWLQDRASLLAYRLRAARYGLMIRLARPFPDIVGLIGLLLGALGVALAVNYGGLLHFLAMAAERQPLGTSAVGAIIFAAVLWLAIRYLGNLSMIMRIAASTSRGGDDIREHMAEGMLNTDAYVQLRRLYEEPVRIANDRLHGKGWQGSFEFVQMGGPAQRSHNYAAIVLPLTEPTRLENLLEGIDANTPSREHQFSRTAEDRQALMRNWREGGSAKRKAAGDEAGDNYHLLEIRVKNESGVLRLVLDVGVATYGQIVRTCDALINEFALYAYLTRSMRLKMRSRTFLRCLPWRRRTHEQVVNPGDIFLRPRDRAAGLGVALVTVLVDTVDDDYVVSLGMRSQEVGTYPFCLHVIPAGMCNTQGTEKFRGAKRSVVPDWFVRTTMRSEWLEEWLDDEALEEGRIVQWQQYVDDKWKDLIGDKPIMLTGLAYDLLNLRPEICGVVMVDKWGDKLCMEYVSRHAHEEYSLAEVGSLEETEPAKIVQSGAAALLLAQRAMYFTQDWELGK